MALLFDLDGTVADTDVVHMEVFRELLLPHGITNMTREYYNTNLSGSLNADLFKRLFPSWSDEQIATMSLEKERRFRERAGTSLEPLPGLYDTMNEARRRGVRIAAVSNAPRLNAMFLIDHLKLRPYFEEIVLGEDCTYGKPHPMPYLVAMEKLKVKATQCIVFEDSVTGVTAGAAAGAHVIGLATGHPPERLTAVGAKRVVKDFTELDFEQLHAQVLRAP